MRELSALGWTPATSSNFSRRLDDRHAAITVSGPRQGPADARPTSWSSTSTASAVGSDHRPSAETLLHTQLYRRFPDIGCVLHTHSQAQTVASRLYAGAGHVRLEGYELLKAFDGNTTHETELDLPVLPNTQDMPTLAAQVDALLDRQTAVGLPDRRPRPVRLGPRHGRGAPPPGGLRIPARLRTGTAQAADVVTG